MQNLLPALRQLATVFTDNLGKLRTDFNEGIAKLREDIRESKKTIELDLTTRAIEKLQETSDLNINKVAKTLEATAKAEGQRLVEVTKAVTQLEKAVREDTTSNPLYREILSALKEVVKAQTTATDAATKGARNTDLIAGMTKLTEAVRANKPEKPEKFNLSVVHTLLSRVVEGQEGLRATIRATDPNTALAALAQAMKALADKKPPDTFKLDETQLRSIRSGGVSVVGSAGPLTANNVSVANVAMAASNTEYSYILPANTVGFSIKLRDQGTLLYYAWTAGKLPTSGDGSAYMTAPQNFIRSVDGIEYSGKTIYLGAESDDQIAEIEVFTA